jgi:hypothetical protein
MKQPAIMRLTDRALNPLIGKSVVVYAAKPAAGGAGTGAGSARKTKTTGSARPEEAHAAA